MPYDGTVRLLCAGIAEGNSQRWCSTSYRVNRIHVPLCGCADYRDIDGWKKLVPGATYLMINGFSQDFRGTPEQGYLHLFFDFQCSPPLLSREMLCIGDGEDPFLSSLFHAVVLLIRAEIPPKEGDRFVKEGHPLFEDLRVLVSVGVSYLRQKYGVRTVENETVADAIRYLREHYAEPIGNPELAEVLHLDSRYLIRLFRRHMGVTPYQYLSQLRIEYSQELLRQGCSVAETAFACGYRSDAAFRPAFRRIMGCSPSEFLHRME